jgi:UDP-N-acetylmuramate dehydrogenase
VLRSSQTLLARYVLFVVAVMDPFMQTVPMANPVNPQRNLALSGLTSIGLGGEVDFLWRVSASEQVATTLERIYDLGHRPFVLGGGSNLVVSDDGVQGSVLTVSSAVKPDFKDDVVVVDGGLEWDQFVALSIAAGRSGVELLSGIPGRVGAAPIQNIGAYGQEVSECIEWVEVLWLKTLQVQVIAGSECGFMYRNSVFKSAYSGQLVVTKVAFRLGWQTSVELSYRELVNRLGERCDTAIGRRVVLEIRRTKGMTMEHGHGFSSAGSFFMNPILTSTALEHVRTVIGTDMPSWVMRDGRIKLAAAWLIERAGFVKGHREGDVGISPRHALSLVNYGTGQTTGLLQLAVSIQTRVFEHLGVWLVMEPELLGRGLDVFKRLKSDTPLRAS